MSKNLSLASRNLISVDRTGLQSTITIAVGKPYEITPTEWACSVRLDGLHDQLPDIHGADSWQALQLANQLIVQLLGIFVQDGGALYWPTNCDRVKPLDLVPRAPQ